MRGAKDATGTMPSRQMPFQPKLQIGYGRKACWCFGERRLPACISRHFVGTLRSGKLRNDELRDSYCKNVGRIAFRLRNLVEEDPNNRQANTAIAATELASGAIATGAIGNAFNVRLVASKPPE